MAVRLMALTTCSTGWVTSWWRFRWWTCCHAASAPSTASGPSGEECPTSAAAAAAAAASPPPPPPPLRSAVWVAAVRLQHACSIVYWHSDSVLTGWVLCSSQRQAPGRRSCGAHCRFCALQACKLIAGEVHGPERGGVGQGCQRRPHRAPVPVPGLLDACEQEDGLQGRPLLPRGQYHLRQCEPPLDRNDLCRNVKAPLRAYRLRGSEMHCCGRSRSATCSVLKLKRQLVREQ